LGSVPEPDAAVRRHGFYPLRVKSVVRETEDARTLVLEVPPDLHEAFRYQPGQFCTLRIHVDEEEHARCYSMSSAPDVEVDLAVTVKRVAGGVVSNWLIDHLSDGDVVEVTRPSGSFCVRRGERPIIAFCGGSGITPVLSIAKSVLAVSARSFRLLYANRDAPSIIFEGSLRTLQAGYPGRLEVRHHLDIEHGLVEAASVIDFVGCQLNADFYICGPGPFMDVVEETLRGLGVGTDDIFIERFTPSGEQRTSWSPDPEEAAAPEAIALILRGKRSEIAYHGGDTVLETARRASLSTPFSCEAGNCATCMAFLREGAVTMRVNDALTPEEVDEGWILTCQAVPASSTVTIEFEPL
jgi:3-ketosteroid 9alpha-monooxygenase subunit B